MRSRIIAALRSFGEYIPSIRAVEEAYLNGAESPAELEQRKREIRAGRFRNAYTWS